MRIALRQNNVEQVQSLWLATKRLDDSTSPAYLADALYACARAAKRLTPEARFAVPDEILAAGDEGAEIGYFLAMEAWMRGSYKRAAELVFKCVPVRAAMRAQLLIMRGMIAWATEQVLEQARLCDSALEILVQEDAEETVYISTALWHLSALTREVPDRTRLAALEQLERSINWNDNLRLARLQIRRALGWGKVIAGDYVDGMRLYSTARDFAADFIPRMLVHLDYANAASFAGSHAAAAAELRCAVELAARVRWNRIHDDRAVALLLAAGIAANLDRNSARSYLDMAKDIARDISPRCLLAHAGYWQAFTAEASALVAAAHDEFFEAQRQAAAACEDFSRMGFSWRAGRMAVLMHQLSGKSYWRDRARTLLAEYPNSVFAKQLGIEAGEVRLTRRQEQVLEFLRRGYTSEAIAAELNMARNTVHTHITAIHRAYGVQRRSELLAKLAGTV